MAELLTCPVCKRPLDLADRVSDVTGRLVHRNCSVFQPFPEPKDRRPLK
jgi:uncharacterized protein YbaR (Trm112 family)